MAPEELCKDICMEEAMSAEVHRVKSEIASQMHVLCQRSLAQ